MHELFARIVIAALSDPNCGALELTRVPEQLPFIITRLAYRGVRDVHIVGIVTYSCEQ